MKYGLFSMCFLFDNNNCMFVCLFVFVLACYLACCIFNQIMIYKSNQTQNPITVNVHSSDSQYLLQSITINNNYTINIFKCG